eukprot:Opistho-2@80646
MPVSVSVSRSRESGVSKGYAFVEFVDVATATALVESSLSVLEIDGARVKVEYCNSRGRSANDAMSTEDMWACIACGGHNFKKSDVCIHCGTECHHPDDMQSTSVVVLHGIDAHTTSHSIHAALATLGVPVVSVRLAKDKGTDASRGFCFAEYATPEAAGVAVAAFRSTDALYIDGRAVSLQFARPPSVAKAKPLSGAGAAALEIVQAQLAAQQQSRVHGVGMDAWQGHSHALTQPSYGEYGLGSGSSQQQQQQQHHQEVVAHGIAAHSLSSHAPQPTPVNASHASKITGDSTKKEKEANKSILAKKMAKDMGRWEEKQAEGRARIAASSVPSSALTATVTQ